MAGRAPRFPTWRYGKRLIWRAHDQWGVVEAVDGYLGKELHFGSAALQGRINLEYPWLPVAEYGVSMSLAAAFPSPQERISRYQSNTNVSTSTPAVPQVCLLGLGTGSLTWTYHHLMPHAQLTVIELRPAVIAVAKSTFGLNKLSPSSLKIMQGDALEQITLLPTASQTLIAIDLFTADNMAECLLQPQFWRELSRIIHPVGVLCINTWGSRVECCLTIQNLIQKYICPGGDLYLLDHLNFTNEILFASPRAVDLQSVIKRSRVIESKLDIPVHHSKRKQKRWLKESKLAGLTLEKVHSRAQRLQYINTKL